MPQEFLCLYYFLARIDRPAEDQFSRRLRRRIYVGVPLLNLDTGRLPPTCGVAVGCCRRPAAV
eukprot:scaffold597930_cov13-Prasinocladus_malaysianus.AAC.1